MMPHPVYTPPHLHFHFHPAAQQSVARRLLHVHDALLTQGAHLEQGRLSLAGGQGTYMGRSVKPLDERHRSESD